MFLFVKQYIRELILLLIVLASSAMLAVRLFVIKKPVNKLILILSAVICVLIVFGIGYAHFILPPQITLVGDKDIVIDVFEKYDDEGITVKSRSGKTIYPDVQVKSDLNTEKTGSYIIKYEFNYRNHNYTAERNVEVADRVSPRISLIGESVEAVENFEDYKDKGCVIIDNYDGDITDKAEVSYSGDKTKEISIKYSVADSSGNEAELVRKVEIRDTTPPQIKLNGYKSETVVMGTKYKEKGISAYDSRDGDVSGAVSVDGKVDTSKLGTYTVKYSATDFTGNVSVETRKVKVVAPEKVSGNSVIYLTFDDGPSDTATEKILNVLKKNNVKATFFIINFDTAEKAELIKRMVREGHTVGIHGYSHVYKDIYASEKAFMKNVDSLRDKVYVLTDYKPTIMRFPGGSSNTVSSFNPGIMTKLTKTVTDKGYIYFDWNDDSMDEAGGKVTSNSMYFNVVAGLKPKRGNVVLMHDIGDGDMKAAAVQKIIDYGKTCGYEFAPITEATKPVRHHINN